MKTLEIEKLATALAKAQGAMEGAKKDAENPFFKKNYSDLASVWASIRKPLSENGLSVAQPIGTVNGQQCVITLLMHTSGQYLKSIMAVKPPKPDMQSLGAAISYARRYALSAMVGVYQVDLDDDEDQSGNGKGQGEPTKDKIRTKKEKSIISGNVPPKDQEDVPIGSVPPVAHEVTPIRRDNFVSPEQATAYRKECVRLRIPTKEMKAELKKHGISMPDKIPADQYDQRFKDLDFLANSNDKEGVKK